MRNKQSSYKVYNLHNYNTKYNPEYITNESNLSLSAVTTILLSLSLCRGALLYIAKVIIRIAEVQSVALSLGWGERVMCLLPALKVSSL